MSEKSAPADAGGASTSSDGLRLGAALWVMAGVVCAGLLLVVFVGENLFLENPGLSALVLAGAIAALLTGGLLLVRPGPGVVRSSALVGVAWLVAFGSLLVGALGRPGADSGPLVSLSLMTGLGLAAAVVTFLSGALGSRPE